MNELVLGTQDAEARTQAAEAGLERAAGLHEREIKVGAWRLPVYKTIPRLPAGLQAAAERSWAG